MLEGNYQEQKHPSLLETIITTILGDRLSRRMQIIRWVSISIVLVMVAVYLGLDLWQHFH